MKLSLFTLLFLLCGSSFAQDKTVITYRQRQDLGQDTYVRIMKTADSLFSEYCDKPFDFEKEDGSCCDQGLDVIRGFYKLAMVEKPGDDDAMRGIAKVEERMMIETNIEIEGQYEKVVNKADEYFNGGYYKKAYELYERAHKLKPTDKEVKKKMKKAKKMMKKHDKL